MTESAAISTGCGPIDDLLDGGFERGTVTQVYGQPAAGKTNIALGAVVETAAAGSVAVYIDSEGLSTARFEQLASAYDEDVSELASRVIIKEVLDFEEQAQAVQDAAELAERADLIVLDSATGFYRLERTEDSEGGEALRSVARQITHLLSLARRYDLAVVLTNQVYTNPETDQIRPLGGHTLEHWTGTVLRVDRFRGGMRRATLEKHRSKPAGETAKFEITNTGLAAVDDAAKF